MRPCPYVVESACNRPTRGPLRLKSRFFSSYTSTKFGTTEDSFTRHPTDDGLRLADSALLRRNRQARTVVIHRHGVLTVAGWGWSPLIPARRGLMTPAVGAGEAPSRREHSNSPPQAGFLLGLHVEPTEATGLLPRGATQMQRHALSQNIQSRALLARFPYGGCRASWIVEMRPCRNTGLSLEKVRKPS